MKQEIENKRGDDKFIAIIGDGSDFLDIALPDDDLLHLIAAFDKSAGPVLIEVDARGLRILAALKVVTPSFDKVRLINGVELAKQPTLNAVAESFDLIEPDALFNYIQDARAKAASVANNAENLLQKSLEKHTTSDLEKADDAPTPDGVL